MSDSAPTPVVNPNAPEFTPAAWNEDFHKADLWGSNCYQYAAAGSLPDGTNRVFDEIPPEPGETTGYPLKYSNVTPIIPQRVMDGLGADGIDAKGGTTLPSAQDGKYIVGIYVAEDGHDFHFVRQDRDGGWSHKPGIGARAERFLAPDGSGEHPPLPEIYGDAIHGDYILVGYAHIPKEGLDLGPEHRLKEELQSCKDISWSFEGKGSDSHKLYDTLLKKYGDEPLACGVSGGENVSVAEHLQCNYSHYSIVDQRDQDRCQQRGI